MCLFWIEQIMQENEGKLAGPKQSQGNLPTSLLYFGPWSRGKEIAISSLGLGRGRYFLSKQFQLQTFNYLFIINFEGFVVPLKDVSRHEPFTCIAQYNRPSFCHCALLSGLLLSWFIISHLALKQKSISLLAFFPLVSRLLWRIRQTRIECQSHKLPPSQYCGRRDFYNVAYANATRSQIQENLHSNNLMLGI